MTDQKKNAPFKIISALLFIVLSVSLFFNFQSNSNVNQLNATALKASADKALLMTNLKDLKLSLDAEIAKSTVLSDELILQRDKVVALISKLQKSNQNVAELQKFKSEYLNLNSKMKDLQSKVELLTNQNQNLLTQNDNAKNELSQTKRILDTLSTSNSNLNSKMLKASKLSFLNLTIGAFKLKSSSKMVATDKASITNILTISFTIAENLIVKPESRTFYVQLIDANNNVLGGKIQKRFGNDLLAYSFDKTIDYKNEALVVTENFEVSDLKTGAINVHIFDKGVLVLKSTLILK